MSFTASNFFRSFKGPLTGELAQRESPLGLGQLPDKLQPQRLARSVCGFCSTGCGLQVHVRDGAAVNLTPDPRYPVNAGTACPKGWESLTPLQAPDRARTPLLRNESGELTPATWDEALRYFVSRVRSIQERHGPESVAFLSTGQMVMEEMAFLGALAKFGMGMIHGDGNTRQCMATSVAAYKQAFGFDAPPYTYQDFEESDLIFLIGSNLCIAHPILWQRIVSNRHNPRIVVIDPRKTETALAATDHIALKPKSDLIFFYSVAQVLIENGWIDATTIERSTRGFEEFARHVSQFPPAAAAVECGLPAETIERCARMIHEGKRVSFWWTMGVNQSHEGTRVAQAIINLALITGNIGRPGTGANSITGQCNAMGSRLFSNTTNLLGGHDFTSAADRKKIATLLNIPIHCIPQQNSWAYDQILEGIDSGKIKGLWIIATNTAHSWIGQEQARRRLANLEFLAVQDLYTTTETAQLAHVMLPAAGWGEKEGCFINSERRIGLIRKVAAPPGLALSDFNIFRALAHYFGCQELFREWTGPEPVFRILQRVTAGQPCDITGITGYSMIEERGGIQWPYPEKNPSRETHRRLFEDGRFYHPDGRARLLFEKPRPPREIPTDAYPFWLLTGRGTSAQWHTQTRTGKSAILRQLYPSEVYVEMHPEDAAQLRISAHEPVIVESRHGSLTARAVLLPTLNRGQVFIPMHYPETNRLTCPDFDPYSRQPSYKAAAVRIRPAG